MRVRLRLSLLGRMAVAIAIHLTITLVLAVILSVVGGFLGEVLLGWLHRGAETIAGLPRVSTVAPVNRSSSPPRQRRRPSP